MPKKKKVAKKKIARKKIVRRKIARRKPVRKQVRKPARRKAAAKKAPAKKRKEPVIGIVTHYFPHVRAAVVKLKAPLTVGDKIKVKGHTTDFTQTITSLQIDRVPINEAKKGQEIGLLVDSRVRQHDVVYKA